MILDERNEFADATSVVGSAAATAVLGDVIDLGASLDIGIGEELWFVMTTDTEVITGGSAGTLQFYLVSDSLATLGAATLASCTEHARSASLVTDDAAANSAVLNAGGVIMAIRLPAGTYERYLGVLFAIGTTDITAGKVNAFLTRDYAKWTAIADGVN